MSDVFIGEYRDGDIDELFANLREHDRVVLSGYGDDDKAKESILKLVKSGYTSTFTDSDGNLIAIWITMPVCDGVACVFSYMTNLVDKHPLGFVKACRRGIKLLQSALNLHRMECTCDAGYEKSMRWLEALGFEVEGLMRNRTVDKRDHILMARLF